MWTYERSAETTARPDAVSACWSDLATWPSWNVGIESITMDGPLEAGTRFTMTTPPDGEVITLRIVDVVLGHRFTDQVDYGGVVVTTIHRLDTTPHGTTRVTYRTEITGPDADGSGRRSGRPSPRTSATSCTH